ncbi:hypothetical protein J4423_01675 [Candidatus Pacearchaeota archaeon]|nr:hypothetical protein [Candidatus Pacearchaeota archaeon]
MDFQESQTLLLRGTLYPHLEEVIQEINLPIQRIASPRENAIKYGAFIEKDGILIIVSQQRDKKENLPNLILAIASHSSQINNSLVNQFESKIQAILDTRFPRPVEIELEKGLIYYLKILEKNKKMGLALLRGDVTREYVEVWEKYSLN